MKARRIKGLDPSAALVENAASIIRVRTEEVRSFADAAARPDDSESQHDMRIAAKRLRYLLELTGFCFGPASQRAGRRAKELQSVLGDLHDCDVMLPRAKELEIRSLVVHLQGRRRLLFERFTQLWEAIEAEETWDDLERAIEEKLRSRSEPRSTPSSATPSLG
jgi:CHAD domain-containing protein